MGSSIEARVPFLDHYLVEYAMSLPEDIVLEGGGSKPLLKEAIKHLAAVCPEAEKDRPRRADGEMAARGFRK